MQTLSSVVQQKGERNQLSQWHFESQSRNTGIVINLCLCCLATSPAENNDLIDGLSTELLDSLLVAYHNFVLETMKYVNENN